MRITFRNAPVIGKDHKVKISILMVEDADSSVIAQLSLDQIAISILDCVRALAQVRRDRAHSGDNRQRSEQKLFHIPSRILLLPIQILHLFRSILAAVIRLFFNQFCGRNSVKRNNCPINVSADYGAVPDILRN